MKSVSGQLWFIFSHSRLALVCLTLVRLQRSYLHTDTLLAEGFVVAVIFVNSCIQEPNCSLCFSFERHWNTAYTEFLFTGWILCPTMDGLRWDGRCVQPGRGCEKQESPVGLHNQQPCSCTSCLNSSWAVCVGERGTHACRHQRQRELWRGFGLQMTRIGRRVLESSSRVGGSKQRCSSGKVTSSRDQHHRMAAVSGGSKTSEEMRGDQLVTVLSYYWNNRLFLTWAA